MSAFPILDLVIGMIFVYFLLGIVCSSAIEIILTGLKARATLLEEWLFKIFDKTITQPDGKTLTLGQAIMDHCSITALAKTGKSTDYIDAKNFTSALLEKITFNPGNPKSIAKDIDEIIAVLEKTTILSTEFQRVLLTYAYEAKDTYEHISEKTESEIQLFRTKVENWFDSSMDRITGALKKRYSRPATFVVAIFVTCLLNADSISIAKYLYSNPEVRTKIAMQAFDAAKDSAFTIRVNQMRVMNDSATNEKLSGDDIKSEINQKITDINKARQGLNDVLPLTWKPGELTNANGNFSLLLLFSKITGLLVTILAIMMGAPFWFDLLNKISNMRGSGAKPPVAANADTVKK